MSSNKRGSEYNILVRVFMKMPKALRVLFVIALVAAMLLLTMSLLSSLGGQDTLDVTPTPFAPTSTPTATPEVPTPTPTAEPTATPTATPTAEPTEEPTPSSEPTPVVYDQSFVMPDASKRPVAVVLDSKGNNVQYITGITEAQIVYEMVGEKGYSSIMALYWEKPTGLQVGALGGARHYMLNLAAEHQAVIYSKGVSVYAKAEAAQKLFGVKLYNSEDGIKNVFSTTNKGVLLNISAIESHWSEEKVSATLSKSKLVFKYLESTETPSVGKSALEIILPFSSSYTTCYTWDTDKHLYLRWRNDMPQFDQTTGEQLTAANIIILKMDSNVIDGDANGMQELNMIGSGIGWFATEGIAQQIVWSKNSRDGALAIKTLTGDEVQLNPGQTWITILPTDSKEVIN